MSTSDDRKQIGELIEERVAAMRAGDAERIVARYAPGVVKFDLAPPLVNRGPGLERPDGLRTWFSTFAGPVEYEVTDLSITAEGGLAFTTSLNRLSATPRGMDRSFELWFRSTLCLRRGDSGWRIVHEHSSTPFHMDGSLRAAVDLRP